VDYSLCWAAVTCLAWQVKSCCGWLWGIRHSLGGPEHHQWSSFCSSPRQGWISCGPL